MKKLFTCLSFLAAVSGASGQRRDSTIYFNLPDSVKAVQFLTAITVTDLVPGRKFSTGIRVEGAQLTLFQTRKTRGISCRMNEHSNPVAMGTGVKNTGFGGFYFPYNWAPNKPYRLMISVAADSAENIRIITGYIFLPDEGKWKLIGSRQDHFGQNRIREPAVFIGPKKKLRGHINTGETWIQRNNGTWKYLSEGVPPPTPVINLYAHADSAGRQQEEVRIINDSIAAGKTDVKQQEGSVYYHIMKEGTGRQVAITDTVQVYYKGYLFSSGTVFDQTKEKPATFPLNRLIRGWQIGVPLCRVGGKIKLVIPSALAYSVRTRAAKIPPNSILVFEIEIVDAKAAAQTP